MDGCIPGSLSTDPPSTSLNSQTGSVAAASIHGKGAASSLFPPQTAICAEAPPPLIPAQCFSSPLFHEGGWQHGKERGGSFGVDFSHKITPF